MSASGSASAMGKKTPWTRMQAALHHAVTCCAVLRLTLKRPLPPRNVKNAGGTMLKPLAAATRQRQRRSVSLSWSKCSDTCASTTPSRRFTNYTPIIRKNVNHNNVANRLQRMEVLPTFLEGFSMISDLKAKESPNS